MRQADLYRAVAKATGETAAIVEHMGFQHVDVPIFRPTHRRRRHRRRRRVRAVCLSA